MTPPPKTRGARVAPIPMLDFGDGMVRFGT
jgi:hypothetical protein